MIDGLTMNLLLPIPERADDGYAGYHERSYSCRSFKLTEMEGYQLQLRALFIKTCAVVDQKVCAASPVVVASVVQGGPYQHRARIVSRADRVASVKQNATGMSKVALENVRDSKLQVRSAI